MKGRKTTGFVLLKKEKTDFFLFPLYKQEKACYNNLAFKQCTGGSMDRASDSGSEGWGFESLPVYQKDQIPFGIWSFCISQRMGLERLNAACWWHAAATSSKTGGNLSVTSPFRCTKKEKLEPDYGFGLLLYRDDKTIRFGTGEP